MNCQNRHVAHRLQLELTGHCPPELRHVVEVHRVVVGNAYHARYVLVILDVGDATKHFVHLVRFDELFHIIECALIGGRGRAGFMVVVKETHNVVTIALIGHHFVNEANTHSPAANDDNTLEVEPPVAV